MVEVTFLVEDAIDGGYVARALSHAIFCEAETVDELRDAVREAVACHFDDTEQPAMIRLHFVRDEVLAV